MKIDRKRAVLHNVFALSVCAALISPALAAQIYAIDGDTIVMDGETIRLANIDAPETHQAKCDAELRLGEVAKRRMEALITSDPVTLIRGDGGRMKDKYGRSLARVIVDGHDVGEILVAEQLARPWDGRRHPWCE
jgi:endonuclease YncB( thermonuclease family)